MRVIGYLLLLLIVMLSYGCKTKRVAKQDKRVEVVSKSEQDSVATHQEVMVERGWQALYDSLRMSYTEYRPDGTKKSELVVERKQQAKQHKEIVQEHTDSVQVQEHIVVDTHIQEQAQEQETTTKVASPINFWHWVLMLSIMIVGAMLWMYRRGRM